MKLIILYRPNSEHARLVEEFTHDFQRWHPDVKMEIKDLNTIDGSKTAELYGVVAYPAILSLTDDGHMLRCWQGEQLPLMNDVAYYAVN